MSTKTKPVLPPARALKDIAAVLARHGAPDKIIDDDSAAQEIARAGTSHLKIARDRFQMSTDPKKHKLVKSK